MGIEQQTVTWIFMMLTLMKKRLGLSQADFISTVKNCDVLNYLLDQYELLHYYDNDYIIESIVEHIKNHCGENYGLSRTAN
jgi:hypothetical protein